MPPPPSSAVRLFTTAFCILFFCTVYLYHGRKDFLVHLVRVGALDVDPQLWGGPFQCAAALVLLLLPGLLAARYALGVSWRELGFGLGDWRFGLKVVLPIAVLVFPAMLLFQDRASPLCEVYPLSSMAARSGLWFAAWAACYLVYYVAWEGLFRGVIQLGLHERLGVLQTMLLQTALSTLLHAGGPEIETFGALVAGPAFGLLALRTGSVYYVLLLHFALGIANDLSCVVAAS